jgi:hypothetical protein
MRARIATLRLSAAAAVLGALLSSSPVHGQGIAGKILDADTNRGVEGVHLILMDTDGSPYAEAVSGSGGTFTLRVPRGGQWVLNATRLGYETILSAPFRASPTEGVVVEVWMTAEPIALEENLVVTGRTSAGSPDIRDFRLRLEQGNRSGVGQFVSRADVERKGASRASELLQSMGGIRVSKSTPDRGRLIEMTRGCVPAIFVDGSHINIDRSMSLDHYVAPLAIEGIEVYRGGHHQVGRFHDPYGCGLVLVWTRRGEQSSGGSSWAGMGVGAVVLGALFLLF